MGNSLRPQVVLACLVLLATLGGAAADQHRLPDGSVYELEVVGAMPKWRLLPYLWTQRTVNVTCPASKDISVFLATTPEQLEAEYKRGQNAWCGLWQWGTTSCLVQISPFKHTIVAVRKPSSAAKTDCVFDVSEHLSPLLMLQGLAGAVLFFNAGWLTQSPVFRLSTGTAGFVLLSLGIVVFILYRSVPNKKVLAASTAVFGSSVLGTMRWFFGTWLPSYDQLIYNKWVLSYLVVSGLLGLAVTYYYDDPANAKLNTILTHGLELLGLALVATSTTLPEFSLALAVAMVAARVFQAHGFPWLRELKRQRLATQSPRRRGRPPANKAKGGILKKALDYAAEMPLPGDITRMVKRHRQCATSSPGTPPTQHHAKGLDASQSPLVQSGLVLNEATGRTIHIGKPTFNKLLSEGYVLDEQKGTITPPPLRSRGRPKTPTSPKAEA